LWRVFQDRVLQTVCPGWFPTEILLISASWVARITGVSHRHPAPATFNHTHPFTSLLPLIPTPNSPCFILLSLVLVKVQIPHMRTGDICLSLSGLFHLTWWSPVPSIFLQMTQFHCSFWLNNALSCACVCIHTYIVTNTYIHIAVSGCLGWSIAWLLWAVLL
jgi:hypothetical protein